MKLLINTARLTLWEVAQGRVFQILLVLSLFSPLLGLVLSTLFMVDIGKVYMDGLMGMVHFISMVFVFFIMASLLSRDLEQKVCYLLVVQPLNRTLYYIGRYFGFLIAYMVLLLALILAGGLVGELFIANQEPFYQSGYTWGNLSLLIFLHAFQYLSLMGLLFFIVAWATGLAEILFFSVASLILTWVLPGILAVIAQVDGGEDYPALFFYILNAIYQLLPHLNGASIALALTHGQALKSLDILFYMLEHISYSGIFMLLGLWLFKRRDL